MHEVQQIKCYNIVGKYEKDFEDYLLMTQKLMRILIKKREKMKICQRISGSVRLTENLHIQSAERREGHKYSLLKKKKVLERKNPGWFLQCIYFGDRNKSLKLPGTKRLIG